MIHKCNVHCFSLELENRELLGGKADAGKWMPFAFDLSMVYAVKLSHDDSEKMTYGCTTIYTEDKETYVIDTPYDRFLILWEQFMTGELFDGSEGHEDDLDL